MAAVISAPNPLVGIWRSDEAAYAFTETRAIIAYDGECMRPFSYRHHRFENRRVRVLVFQPKTENVILELELRPNQLRMDGEIFRRSSPKEVAPCIGEWLEKREAEESLEESVPIAGPADAAELAARFANDECQHQYGIRPFSASDWPIELARGRWTWGRINAFAPQGYSAVVSFERNGTLPLVRIYAQAIDIGPNVDFSIEPKRPRLEPHDKFWRGNDKLVPP